MAHGTDLEHTAECACETGLMCADTRPGHGLHAVQLRLAAATPSQWRDALVTGVDDRGRVHAITLDGDPIVWWNHGDLATVATAGEPVAWHPIYNVLSVGDRRFNVLTAR
jgi:hypothetical protein